MDPNPAIFVIDLQEPNKKLYFLKSLSAYYFLKVHLHNFSNIKSQKEVTKQKESRVFLLFLFADRRRIREARKHVDPDPDSDLEHWLKMWIHPVFFNVFLTLQWRNKKSLNERTFVSRKYLSKIFCKFVII